MSMLFISPLARLHFPLAHALWTWHLHDVWHVSVFTIRLQRCLSEQSRWATPLVHVLHPPISPSLLTTRSVFCIKCVSVGQRSLRHMHRAHVAWLYWTHIKLPSAPDPRQWKRTRAWRRERERRDSATYKEWAKSYTNSHNTSWGERKRRSHFLLTCNVIDVGVCISGCAACVKSDSVFKDMLTPLSWNSWE